MMDWRDAFAVWPACQVSCRGVFYRPILSGSPAPTMPEFGKRYQAGRGFAWPHEREDGANVVRRAGNLDCQLRFMRVQTNAPVAAVTAAASAAPEP